MSASAKCAKTRKRPKTKSGKHRVPSNDPKACYAAGKKTKTYGGKTFRAVRHIVKTGKRKGKPMYRWKQDTARGKLMSALRKRK